MATALSFNPTWVSTTLAPYTLGAVYTDAATGYMYKCVQVVTAAGADGVLVCRYSSPAIGASLAATGIVIGANRTTALAGTPAAIIPVGVLVAAVPINSYAFAMVYGIHTNVLSTSSTLGTLQKASGTNDTCTDGASAGDKTFGFCLVATSGGRCVVDVRAAGV